MNWIIWTIGFWVAICIGQYLDSKRANLEGRKYDRETVAIEQLILVCVWILGMWKFW